MTRLALVALAAFAALPLASCGRQGERARPAPLFGSGGNLPPQTSTGPAAASDPDGDPVEGTERDQPGSTRSTGVRRAPANLDPSRSRTPASSNPIEGTTAPIGDRPSVTPR